MLVCICTHCSITGIQDGHEGGDELTSNPSNEALLSSGHFQMPYDIVRDGKNCLLYTSDAADE